MTFRNVDLFPPSGEGGRRHLLSKAPYKELISIIGRKQVQFPKRHVSTLKNSGQWKKPKNSIILCDEINFV
jgi:hypothetical protein